MPCGTMYRYVLLKSFGSSSKLRGSFNITIVVRSLVFILNKNVFGLIQRSWKHSDQELSEDFEFSKSLMQRDQSNSVLTLIITLKIAYRLKKLNSADIGYYFWKIYTWRWDRIHLLLEWITTKPLQVLF